MRYLVDTHVWLRLLWSLESPGKLSPGVRTALEHVEDLVLSIPSIWALAIESRLGKMALPSGVRAARGELLHQAGARESTMQSEHALLAAELPLLRRDPIDRLSIAQAKLEQLTLVTADEAIRAYGAPLQWAS